MQPNHSPELKALRHEILQRCLQLDLEPKVLGDGRLDSEIVIIGQGPGSYEVTAKSPFVGPTGGLLWNTLRQHGILRTDCYVTNVCKRQYSIDKRSDLGRDEWTKWHSLLQYELTQLKNPKVIFALGNAALEALTGFTGITNYRGSVYDYVIKRDDGTEQTVKVVYSFNPANVIRNPEDEIIFQFDARRVRGVAHGEWTDWPVTTTYDLSFIDAMAEIGRFKRENKPTAVDIELTGGELACVGLANDEHEATCINFRGQLENIYTQEQEAQLLFALQDLYESLGASDNLIAQNAAFDAGFSGLRDNISMPVSYDTMLMHHCLYPTLPHSLQFLTSQYTSIPYYKDEYSKFKEDGDVKVFWEYNGKDCCATLASFNRLKAQLQEQKLWDFYNRHIKRLQGHAISAQIHGIATDTEMRDKVSNELNDQLREAQEKFLYLIDLALPNAERYGDGSLKYKPNPSSWQQLKVLFYDKLKLKHKTEGTDQQARLDLLNDERTPLEAKEIITQINVISELRKFLGTFVDLRLDKDQRFRCVWKQEGVRSAPGRLSSAGTLWGTGGNAQNQPPAARKFFIADPGCCLVYFDLKQAEAVVVAYRADIDDWKADFERMRLDGSFDAHRSLAAQMFKLDYDQVPKSDRNEDDSDYTVRYIAKRCRHGLNYRMQIARLAETTGLSFGRAAQSYHTYHRTAPGIQKWWREQERLVRSEREIYNAFGRRFKILQRIDEDALVPIIAFYPQSTIGDKVCEVWYKSEEDDRWDNHKARIIFNVHDSLTAVCTLDYAKTALSIMKAYAEQPLLIEDVYRKNRSQVIIPADTAISSLDVKDKKGNLLYTDKYHRWSNLVKQHIDAAPLQVL